MSLPDRTIRRSLPIFLTLALAACQSASDAPSRQMVAVPPPAAATPGELGIVAFSQAACGGCHAVRSETLSPNPASPAFAEIANRSGLTQASLATWLRDAHNYPEDMDFDLDGAKADALAAYILSLREADYRAPIS